MSTHPINIGKMLAGVGFRSPAKTKRKTIHYLGDLKPYRSPLSQKEITSRSQRREEMKVFNVREVDPSENPHRDGKRYISERNERKYSPKHKRN